MNLLIRFRKSIGENRCFFVEISGDLSEHFR